MDRKTTILEKEFFDVKGLLRLVRIACYYFNVHLLQCLTALNHAMAVSDVKLSACQIEMFEQGVGLNPLILGNVSLELGNSLQRIQSCHSGISLYFALHCC